LINEITKKLTLLNYLRGQKQDEKRLYPVNIVERKDGCAKVHYIGYSVEYDEWKKEEELEEFNEDHLESSPYDSVS